MTSVSLTVLGLRTAAVAGVALAVIGLAGCAGEANSVERAQAQVTSKEKAVVDAQADFAAASETFCGASNTYVVTLDRYGDVLNDTAPTVGDVKEAGTDLAKPRENALEGAEQAVEAQQELVLAEQELADARAALEQAKAGPSASPSDAGTGTPQPTPSPLAPAATVERVKQAETEFAAAQGSVTDQTALADASEQFNAAAVALELAWLRLMVDAGCLTDEQTLQAEAAASGYTAALQQDLVLTGYYDGAVDGVYGPATVASVEALQEANGLPVTGTVDNATADALQAELLALGGAAAQESLVATASVQQSLKILGFWPGAVDGIWTPELTEAVKALQTELGVEPSGTVDAATISAIHKAIAELKQPEPPANPSPAPSNPDPTPANPAPTPTGTEAP
jgi:peptidoglycan hydrolase-like protein with peptidoglycan-binding domain